MKIAEKELKDRLVRGLLVNEFVSAFRQYKAAHPTRPEQPASDHPPEILHTRLRVHEGDVDKTSYTIPSPLGSGYYGDDESDDEDDKDLSGWTMVIIRSRCGGCDAQTKGKTLATPTELTWQNHKNTPDNCPLCHRILFKKSPMY
jgi:hypothetical protein